MARPASQQPTEGELEILKILWETGPAGLSEICSRLQQDRPVAKTTVATMLGVMLDKGLVTRTGGPRQYLWRARSSQRTTTRQLLTRFTDRVFDGSAHLLVARLLEDKKLSEADREAIRRLLDEQGDSDTTEQGR
jgi:predicted transcriptional regulator